MFFVFLFFISGIAVGFFLRKYPNIKFLGKLISVTIVVLLFLLGKSVGKNDAIMNNLGTIGMQALVITAAAIAGSVIMSMVVYRYFFAQKKSLEAEIPSEKLTDNPVSNI